MKIEPNVMYYELNLLQFPLHLKYLIPNAFYRSFPLEEMPSLKAIAMVTMRDVEDEELFSDYCFIGKAVGK